MGMEFLVQIRQSSKCGSVMNNEIFYATCDREKYTYHIYLTLFWNSANQRECALKTLKLQGNLLPKASFIMLLTES